MEQVLIIGATGGIGGALAALADRKWAAVTTISRKDGFDLLSPASIADCLGSLAPGFDRVFVATGVLAAPGRSPDKALSRVSADDMAQVMAVNAIGPALVLAQLPRLLRRDRGARVGVLSARVGSIGDNRLGGWHSYRASKAALNMIVRGAAIELARSHPQAVLAALHPGTVDTGFSAAYPHNGKLPASEAALRLWAVLDSLEPAHSGGFFDHQGQAVPW